MCTFIYLTEDEGRISHSPKEILEALAPMHKGRCCQGMCLHLLLGLPMGFPQASPYFTSTFPELRRATFSLFKTHSQCFHVRIKSESLQAVQWSEQLSMAVSGQRREISGELMTALRDEWSSAGRQWDAVDCGTGCSQTSLFQKGHKLAVAVARSACVAG